MKLEERVLKSELLKKCFFTAFSAYAAFHFSNTQPAFAQPSSEAMYHFLVGNLQRKNDDLDAAFRSYLKAYNLEPHSATICNSIGEVLFEDGKFDFAFLYFRDAVNIDREYLPAHRNLASYHLVKFDYPKLLFEAEFILSRKPDDTTALRYAGDATFHMKRYDESKEYFKKIISLDKNDPDVMYAYHKLGLLTFEEEKFKDAIDLLKKSTSMADKENPADRMIAYRSYFFISLSQYIMKDYDEALDSLTRLIKSLLGEKDKEVSKEVIEMIEESRLMERIDEAIQKKNRKIRPKKAITK
ncbi:MAG: tetratricopeptide repeat protein [Candidatus Nanoarchaeia archaeon]